MENKRQALLSCFIGATGSGKTTICSQMIKHFRKSHKSSKVIGFDPHDVLMNEELLDHYIMPSDDAWAERMTKKDKAGNFRYANCFLALDDYRALLRSNVTPDDVLDLLMLRRRMSLDIVYITHNPKLILERFAYFTNQYCIFYTESEGSDFSDKIPKYSICQKGANLINRYVMKLGGVDSNIYRSLYPNFPYVVINTKTSELNCINMDQKIVSTLYG